MAKKVLRGVGPGYPQIVVLVGATGDLSRRKLLPGLFHLASAGFIPGLRVIGVSLDDLDADGFRAVAPRRHRPVLHAQDGRGGLGPVRRSARLRVPVGRPAGARRRGEARRRGVRRRDAADPLPQRAARGGAAGRAHAGRSGSGRPGAHHHGEAVRHGSRQRGGAERGAATRSSPRTASSASTTSSARNRPRTSWRSASPTACSSRSGTATSSTTCRSTCPRPSVSGSARAFYEADRRLSRHGGHPPVPDPRLHGDGGADLAGAGADLARRRTKSSARWCRSIPKDVVRGQYSGLPLRARGRSGIRHRDLHRAQVPDRQLALGRGCPSSCAPASVWRRGSRIISIAFREPPKSMFPVGSGVGAQGPGPPHLRPRRRLEECRSRSTASVPGPGMRLDKQSLQFSMRDNRPASATCSKPTSA